MNKEGLFSAPRFNDIEYYLGEGELTKQSEFIKYVGRQIEGNTDGKKVRNLMVWINENIPRVSERDEDKFRKSADTIIRRKKRTGCSDSAIVFSAIARSMGIPTIQIISYDKNWAKALESGEPPKSVDGHFFCAVFVKEQNGSSRWMLVDTDQKANKPEEVSIIGFNKDNRNMPQGRYAFAYVIDHSEIEVDGIKIDSVEHMGYIQEKSAKEVRKSESEMEL